jgi:hypothetical protein
MKPNLWLALVKKADKITKPAVEAFLAAVYRAYSAAELAFKITVSKILTVDTYATLDKFSNLLKRKVNYFLV